MEEHEFQWTHIRHQYYATIAANLIALSHGQIMGWMSPATPILTSEETPLLSGPLTTEQISWVGSITCIGGLLGALSFGFFITRMGSKRSVLFLAVPVITFWLLIYFGNTFYHLLIARLIGGYAGGGVPGAVLLFTSEIANDEIRGRLSSIMRFLRNVGTLTGFILGASVDYDYIPCFSVITPIVFLIIFIAMPNTPRYLLHKGKFQKAEKALKFYKGYKGNNQEEDNAIQNEMDRLKAFSSESKTEEKLEIADFFDRKALKGLGIGIALVAMAQCTANFALTSYAVMTFAKVGTNVDPYLSSILLAVALILGSLTTTYLADKVGRKMLNLISLMGSACGLLATALYYYLSINGYDLSSYAWLPVASLSFVVFISAAGIGPLALICSIEYLPPKVRTYGIAIISCSLSLFGFAATKMYPILLETIDLHGCFLIFGSGCILGFLFVLFVMKETSGKSLDRVGVSSKTNTIDNQA